ncbi:MAG: hypothetical protein ACPK85_04460 [Methanosarcina sp.]
MVNEIKRMNYYNGLFLKEEDFTTDQDYSIKMRRLMNWSLNKVFGVLEGLKVEPSEGKKYRVTSGVALSKGEDNWHGVEMILTSDREVDFSKEGPGDYYLIIKYNEVKGDKDESKGGQEIHLIERPIIEIKSSTSSIDKEKEIILVKVTVPNGEWKTDGQYLKEDERKEIGPALRCINNKAIVGTFNQSATLEINGDVKAKDSELESLSVTGNASIGTDKPRARLHVEATDKPTIMAQSEYGGLVSGSGGGNGVFGTNIYIDSKDQLKTAGTHTANYGYAGMRATWGNIHFYASDGNTTEKGDISPLSRFFIRGSDGNVGIGTGSPNARLDVNGDIRINDRNIWLRGATDTNHGIKYLQNVDGPILFGWTGGALGFHGGTKIALKWDSSGNLYAQGTVKNNSSDLAENYPSDMNLESGDVICLAQDKEKIVISEKPNDPMVLGVVSTKPGFLLNEKEDAKETNLFPVALCGRVPCKVVDENGSIKTGDLLTSSSTPGHAMKASPIKGREFFISGTIIGKAIGTLELGKGIIDIFVFSS